MITASELIVKNGYDSTSVANICAAADISKGAFYYHFPSKQDLFIEMIKVWLGGLDTGFNMVSGSEETIPEQLINMAGMIGQLFQEVKSGFPILIEFWRQANLDHVIWQQAITPYHRYLEFFENMVKDGIKEESFDRSVDPQIAARIFISLAMGLLLQASFDPESVSWDETTKTGMQLIINGLRRSV